MGRSHFFVFSNKVIWIVHNKPLTLNGTGGYFFSDTFHVEQGQANRYVIQTDQRLEKEVANFNSVVDIDIDVIDYQVHCSAGNRANYNPLMPNLWFYAM
ncbi:hypothetical protein D9M71_724400 [compost metagenome]